MTKFKVEKAPDVYEDIEADAFQVDGMLLIFVRTKPGIVTAQNPKGQPMALPYKVFREWVSVTDLSIVN